MEKINNISHKIKLIFLQFSIIIFYLLLNIFLAIIFGNSLVSANILISNISNILVNLIILVIFIIIFRKIIVPDFNDFKKNWKQYIKDNYKYYLIGLILMVLSNMIISYFIGMPSNEEINRNILFEMPIYSILAMIIFAPIIEELMTRVILKDIFKKPYFYIIFSGLIFGSLHLLSATNLAEIFYIFPYGILGSAFALIYYKTNNVWTNISFHALHNFIALALIFTGA